MTRSGQLANIIILLIIKVKIRKNQAHHFMQLLSLCKSSYVATNNTHIKVNSLPTCQWRNFWNRTFFVGAVQCSVPLKNTVVNGTPSTLFLFYIKKWPESFSGKCFFSNRIHYCRCGWFIIGTYLRYYFRKYEKSMKIWCMPMLVKSFPYLLHFSVLSQDILGYVLGLNCFQHALAC